MPYELFDRSRLRLLPLSERRHDMTLDDVMVPGDATSLFESGDIDSIAEQILEARRRGGEVILMMGAHVIKRGLSRLLVDLMERGIVTHIGLNGAGAIHDFELALIGATTESVADYIQTGQFGLWQETGRVNDAARDGMRDGTGLGEAIGRVIAEGEFPHKEISILAAGFRLRIPVTVHVGVGYDIVHEHPSCDGASVGETSYRDFLIFANTVTRLEGGVLLNLGSAVMGPEVYLKALAMARNVAAQEGREIKHFTTAVFDLAEIGDYHLQGAMVAKLDPRSYFRPCKTILVRTVQDGGESFYIRADHRLSIPALYSRLIGRHGCSDV